MDASRRKKREREIGKGKTKSSTLFAEIAKPRRELNFEFNFRSQVKEEHYKTADKSRNASIDSSLRTGCNDIQQRRHILRRQWHDVVQTCHRRGPRKKGATDKGRRDVSR